MDEAFGLRHAIHQAIDPMAVMRRVVAAAVRLIERGEGAVVEMLEDGALHYVCATGTLAEHVGTRLDIDGSLSGTAVRSGAALRCDDAATDPRVDADACRRDGEISMICVPLRRETTPVGVLKVTASQVGAFDAEDVATLARLAEFVTETITSAERLARLAIVLVEHELTGDALPTSVPGAGPAQGISEFVANVLQADLAATVETRRAIENVLHTGSFSTVFQPVVDLRTGSVAGYEALTRFDDGTAPDQQFADGHRAGLGMELEAAAVERALRSMDSLPDDTYLAINVGPDLAVDATLRDLLDGVPADRVVIELTEHARIDDYDAMRPALQRLRRSGVRLAIDDTGAGYASFGHILRLAPDFIKLDRILTTGIDVDGVRRSMAGALVGFASETGARVIAEGIETRSELDTVRDLGIESGQGYFLGRPAPVADLRQVSGAAPKQT